jgi:Ion channel
MRAEEDVTLFGNRRGWTLRERLRALDSYGLLLLMILLSLVVSVVSLPGLETLMTEVRMVVLIGTLAFALHTSNATGRAYVICAILACLALVLTLGAGLLDVSSRASGSVASASAFFLVTAVLITVLRRFGAHPVVTGNSILAAISIYLFVGLAYSTVYGFIAAADLGPLFAAGAGDGTSVERVYYSFITLTTTGYGDFVPAGDVTRMVAVTEALLGQVYLVTIVALLVSNVGATRRRRVGPDPGEGEPGAG